MKSLILDANLYVSYFVNRNREQYEVVSKYIQDLEDRKIKIFLPGLILAEVVYILNKVYEFERGELSEVLLSLVSEANLEVDHKEIILSSLEIFKSNNLDFADCYLLAFKENDEYRIITFDKKLKNKFDE